MKVRRKGLFRYSKHTTYFIIIFVISVLVGVGYALLTSTLNINGDSAITRNMWDVHFENIQIKEGSKNDATVEIVNNSTTVNFDINLEEQGEYLDFTVDIVNNGTIDAMLSNITNTGISEASKQYLDYSLTYDDGIEIKPKDLLEAGASETIHVYAKYKDNIDPSQLPEDDVVQEVFLSMPYVQADESAVPVEHPICRRATTLHNDGTHTFGNLGSGNTISAGDAFDCDVNKDKNYDPETERFYYISELDSNSSYAVLVYYNNVSAGSPSNTERFPYRSEERL